MVEFKDEIVQLERLIEGRAEERFKEFKIQFIADSKRITVNKKTLIEQLEQVKSDINKEHEKAMKFYKEGMDAYIDFIKSHAGSRQLNDPPDRPKLPKEYETIGGYINMFKCYMTDEVILDFDFLKEIFMKTSEGMNSAIGSTVMYASFCSGNALAVSNYSLNATTSNWGK
ncbi:MAG: hypothetical protein IMZ52_04750 [Actinobacteria bacterium]|nr:hypothetical protein [Actinomycetota bacterium]MBE3114774.1 hypothetical protein [Actinomycetota bacterium]